MANSPRRAGNAAGGIIKLAKPKGNFTILHNSVLLDLRLSVEARGGAAYLFSRPAGFQVRPGPLSRQLGRYNQDGTIRPLGRTKLNRLFDEWKDAGYLRRSIKQAHREEDGSFCGFIYVFGMPDDVDAAVRFLEGEGIRFFHLFKAALREIHITEILRRVPCR